MKFKTYLFEYNFKNEKWSFSILAASPEEAQLRLNALVYARYLGELQFTLPAELGWFGKIVCWWKNKTLTT